MHTVYIICIKIYILFPRFPLRPFVSRIIYEIRALLHILPTYWHLLCINYLQENLKCTLHIKARSGIILNQTHHSRHWWKSAFSDKLCTKYRLGSSWHMICSILLLLFRLSFFFLTCALMCWRGWSDQSHLKIESPSEFSVTYLKVENWWWGGAYQIYQRIVWQLRIAW